MILPLIITSGVITASYTGFSGTAGREGEISEFPPETTGGSEAGRVS